MKKKYEAPVAEVIEFDYKEQVVAESRIPGNQWADYVGGPCTHYDSATGIPGI